MRTFVLLQVRTATDPMRFQERRAFARAIGRPTEAIRVHDLLRRPKFIKDLQSTDVVLIGGSGDFSATGADEWLLAALDGLRRLRDKRVPLFASCWGFQAIARAFGGEVERDEARAEVGTFAVHLTDQGAADLVFGKLPTSFDAHMGHRDHVTTLPDGAIRLAYTERSQNQAYTFADAPVYATQFHPELSRDDLVERLRQYPEYIPAEAGETPETFLQRLRHTPESSTLLRRFLDVLDRND